LWSWWWGLLGSTSVPTGGQFDRCARGKKLQLMTPVSICRKALIALTSMVMVTRVHLTVAMPSGTTLATSTLATTEGSMEEAGIIESEFWRVKPANHNLCPSIVPNNLKSCVHAE
jgi:hypothetical protein